MSGTHLFSIITPVFNCAKTIEQAVKSVSGQSCQDVEHIIVDKGSTDGTLGIIEKHKNSSLRVIHEPKEGLYAAINRGLEAAGGEIIGILNADDIYANNRVLELVSKKMNEGLDACWGNLYYVQNNDTDKIVRFWVSSEASAKKLRKGWMPAHPTFFVRSRVYRKYGYFNTHFKISADYEIMLRFLYKYGIKGGYIPQVLTKMRMGGESNKDIMHLARKSIEDYEICRLYRLSNFALLSKIFSKIPQFFQR